MTEYAPSMAQLQESDYGEGRDYTVGSPHLRHRKLRVKIERDLQDLVAAAFRTSGRCRVVEVGAGHGTFTAALVRAGAQVTVTEMSEPSVRLLERKYAGDERVRVIYDLDGQSALPAVQAGCDLIVFVSVLHHIPDYLTVVGELTGALADGGCFYSAQDPMWYPDRSWAEMAIYRTCFALWRLSQGNLRRGLKTVVRRLRGVYDVTSPSDMVEYHVVRRGVDQAALRRMLAPCFESVTLWQYWSTQSAALHRLGTFAGWTSTFGVTALNHRNPSHHRAGLPSVPDHPEAGDAVPDEALPGHALPDQALPEHAGPDHLLDRVARRAPGEL